MEDNGKDLQIAGEEVFYKDLEYDTLCADDLKKCNHAILRLALESLNIN